MGRVLYKDAPTEFPRAAFPGLYWSSAAYMERVTDYGSILELTNGKSLLGVWAGSLVTDTGTFRGAFLDLIGPWR